KADSDGASKREAIAIVTRHLQAHVFDRDLVRARDAVAAFDDPAFHAPGLKNLKEPAVKFYLTSMGAQLPDTPGYNVVWAVRNVDRWRRASRAERELHLAAAPPSDLVAMLTSLDPEDDSLWTAGREASVDAMSKIM